MNLTDTQVSDLATPLVGIIAKFYEDQDNEKGFQEWLKERQKTKS